MKTHSNVVIIRKDLNADSLFDFTQEQFTKIPEHRIQPQNKLSDSLMSGLAVFSLKDPSLLAFQKRRDDQTVKNIYHIENIPSDTNMRIALDDVQPESIYPIFKKILAKLQRGKGLEDMVFYDGHYLISNDGTGYFGSEKVHCDQCMIKNHTNGKIEYYHQFLGSVMVHPDSKVVLPLCPEPIQNTDGNTKNDSERNASKRWMKRFRKDHPHMKIIVVADALASNAPHLKLLQEYNIRYIIGIKPGSHSYLFSLLNETPTTEHTVTDTDGTQHKFRFLNNVALNESHADTRVNVIEYCETKPNGKKQHFTWVTDIPVTTANIYKLMRGGRARWKVENETFNTLKNQDYNFEHNFGHGRHNLSTVFALLMMLAFLIDQIQQKCCAIFRAAWVKCGSKRLLWEHIRAAVIWAGVMMPSFQSMADILFQISIRESR